MVGLFIAKLNQQLCKYKLKTMYKRVLDHLNTAILLFDPELILTFINTSGEILLADSAHHLVGQTAEELFRTSDPALLINLKQSLAMRMPEN